MRRVDAVVVSYDSAEELRACALSLLEHPGTSVTIVDNASRDRSLATVADLDVRRVALPDNRGFGFGCNVGWRSGTARLVLFINPDARIDGGSLQRLVEVMEADPGVAIAAPRIIGADGRLHHSLRRFSRPRSTWARAVFAHRLLPRAAWTDELVRDPRSYEIAGSPEWVSGACLLVRRTTLEALGGFDERFFLYHEDMDLCLRARLAGGEIRYEPRATARHVGGASAPRASLYPVLASSRVLYARKHEGRLGAGLERAGVALEAATHAVVCRGGRAARRGHLAALRSALSA